MHAILSPNVDLNLDVNPEVEDFSEPENSTVMRGLKVMKMNGLMPCHQAHLIVFDESILPNLAEHQMHIKGARKCCQCAYNSGFQQGSLLQEFISLDVDSLGDAKVNAEGHYKSIHQAFAIGYSDGVNKVIKS